MKTCKDCSERHTGCHGTCEIYAEQRRIIEERKEKVSEQKLKERILDELEYERIMYAKKKKGAKR